MSFHIAPPSLPYAGWWKLSRKKCGTIAVSWTSSVPPCAHSSWIPACAKDPESSKSLSLPPIAEEFFKRNCSWILRFPSFLRVTNVKDAASTIVRAVRRGDTLVFIPEYVFYLWLIIKWVYCMILIFNLFTNYSIIRASWTCRILPARVYHLVLDFFDTGLEPHDE